LNLSIAFGTEIWITWPKNCDPRYLSSALRALIIYIPTRLNVFLSWETVVKKFLRPRTQYTCVPAWDARPPLFVLVVFSIILVESIPLSQFYLVTRVVDGQTSQLWNDVLSIISLPDNECYLKM
jgi:hypothetical protein